MTQETAVIHAASTDDERDDLRIVDGGDMETGNIFGPSLYITPHHVLFYYYFFYM